MLSDQWSKPASIAAGVFSLTATAVQVMELPLWLRIVIGSTTIASALLAFASYFQYREYLNAVDWVERRGFLPIRGSLEDYVYRPASTEAAFAEVCRTSAAIYRDDNVPESRSRKWWKKFPEGVFAAYWEPMGKTPELAAYISVWPLKASAYNRLRLGELREVDITHHSIESIQSTDSKSYWYVANIVVAKRHRKTEVLKWLVHHSVAHWIERKSLAANVNILAFGYSREGENLLRRFGFHMLTEKSLDDWPVFEHVADLDKIKKSVSKRLAIK